MIYNGTGLQYRYSFATPGSFNMSIEAFNLAGSATSPVGTVTIYSQHYPLATGALIGVIVGATALVLIVALLVCASVLAGRRKDKSSGLPSILSNDFDNERLAMVWYYKWQRYSGWLVWYQFWIRPIFYLFFFSFFFSRKKSQQLWMEPLN